MVKEGGDGVGEGVSVRVRKGVELVKVEADVKEEVRDGKCK